MLKIQDLNRSFGKKQVLKNVTFSVDCCQIIGIIGPNGSGKTTLLNILTGMIRATKGSFEFAPGLKLGMAISRSGFFDDMTTENNLSIYKNLNRLDDTELKTLIQQFALTYGSVLYGKLSAGMKQRASLLAAFLGNPDLIFLDEPSNHLDVDSIIFLRTLLLKFKKQNSSVLLTSHVLSDLERICDRILFLKEGNLIGNETTMNLIQSFGTLENAYLKIFGDKDNS